MQRLPKQQQPSLLQSRPRLWHAITNLRMEPRSNLENVGHATQKWLQAARGASKEDSNGLDTILMIEAVLFQIQYRQSRVSAS